MTNYLIKTFFVTILLGLLGQTEAHHVNQHVAVENFKRFVQNCRQTLQGKQVQDIGNIRESVSRANGGFNVRLPLAPIPKESIARGLIDFVNQNQHHQQHHQQQHHQQHHQHHNYHHQPYYQHEQHHQQHYQPHHPPAHQSRKDLEMRFERDVIGNCQALTMLLQPVTQDYHYLAQDIHVQNILDMDSLEWLTNCRICFDILRNGREFRKRVLGRASGLDHLHHKVNRVLKEAAQLLPRRHSQQQHYY